MAFKDKKYDCWARIDGKDYPIAFGWTLTEEFSETLDSATIILPHVKELIDLKPYDDVIIHDFDGKTEFLPSRPYGVRIEGVDDDKRPYAFQGRFYKHMLVGSFSREVVSFDKTQSEAEKNAYEAAKNRMDVIINDPSLSPEEKERLLKECMEIMEKNAPSYRYNYTIDLISETKGLETVQLPNKTITQRMNVDKDYTSDSKGPSFSFMEGTYVLPYSLTDNWRDGTLIDKNDNILAAEWRDFYLYGGDSSQETVDFMDFSKFRVETKAQTEVLLPDWSVSAVSSTVVYKTLFGIVTNVHTVTYHPVKHWVIRKVGPSDHDWTSRASIIENIKDYIGGHFFDYPEIKNHDIVKTEYGQGVYDIHSSDDISSIVAKFPEVVGALTDNYVIYLYVENQNSSEGTYGLFDVNVFGMAKAGEKPTSESEFLAYWEVKCTNSKTLENHGVLSVYEAIRQAIEIYSPYVKLTDDGETWYYKRKYSIAPETKELFSNVIAPENQWNYPNLRDFITRLFYVSDCIPVVHDNVIGHMNLSQRNGDFVANETKMSYESYAMDGNSYCDRALRNYSDGLSKGNVVKCVERIGFKNANSPTLTLENLKIELSHPIYRINKVYLCYYGVFHKDGEDYMRLCKQDISPLILLNEQRNLLSENWSSVNDLVESETPSSIYELAKYKYATIGYDIGAREISGWGQKYTYPKWIFWSATRTVIENIYTFVSQTNFIGVYDQSEDFRGFYQNGQKDVFVSNASENREAIKENESGGYETYPIERDRLIDSVLYKQFFGNFTQRIKSLMFIIEYEGYVSSAVLASKDFHDGNITIRDNASSSLSFVESDGINQKEKVNRLGNPSVTASARYKDYKDIQNIASVWNDDTSEWLVTKHKDDVMFKRTITFNRDYVSTAYYFCRNFILRNYFTSVFSKHRPFALASYSESVERQENRTMEVLFSAKEAYWQNESKYVNFSYDVAKLISFYTSSSYDSQGNLIVNDGIDSSYYVVYPSKEFNYKGQSGIFATDIQKFVSGNSLCFVVSMKDNVSAGVFSSNLNHNLGLFIGETIKSTIDLAIDGTFGSWSVSETEAMASNLLTGAKQDWFMFPIDPLTGMVYSMSFGVGFHQGDVYGVKGMTTYSQYDISSAQLLPLMDVVLKKTDGNCIYFGKYDDIHRAVGLGYPYISFTKRDNEGRYMVDFSARQAVYEYDDLVIEEEPLWFATPDGEDLPKRNKVIEFASAKFVGKETEMAEETDTCVFKDGKERIFSTIQFEPINEDGSVMFSSYMMKLSDAMGGLEKNYQENKITSDMKFLFGVTNIICDRSANNTSDVRESFAFSFPTLTIAVPHGFSNPNPIEINETFSVDGKDAEGTDIRYTITVYQLVIEYDSKRIRASCKITFPDEQHEIDDGTIYFNLLVNNSTISCRSGNGIVSSFACFDAGMDYDSYVMVDDTQLWYVEGSAAHNRELAVFIQTLLSQDKVPYIPYLITTPLNANLSLFKHKKDSAYDFSECPLNNENGNFKNIRIECFGYHSAGDEIDSSITSISGFNASIVREGPQTDATLIKRKNMFWVLSEPMTKETPYKTYTEEPQSPIDVRTYFIKNGKGIYEMHFEIPTGVEIGSSLRLYYLDSNGVYNFVFGANIAQPVPSGSVLQEQRNFLYPIRYSATKSEYLVYLSFLDSRSKKVINNIPLNSSQGDQNYKVANYADDSETPPEDSNYPYNKCVEK